MRLPKTTKSRVWLAVGALTALAVIAFSITAYNLWQDGNTPSASKAKTDKNAIPAGPTGYPTFSDSSTPTAGASSTAFGSSNSFGKGVAGANPFATSIAGDTGPHVVTITVTSDVAAYVGYRYRDKKAGGTKVVGRSFSITRTVPGSRPSGQVGVQVPPNSTYATCSIAIDGKTVVTRRVDGVYGVVVCTG